MTEDLRQRASRETEVSSLERTVRKFKKMFLETFDDHCDSGLHNLNYLSIDLVEEDIRRYGTLSILDSSLNENINVLIRYSFKTSSQMRRTQMMRTVDVIERKYERGVSNRRE